MTALADYREVLMGDPCAYCGEPTEQIDHIEPRAGGGADVPMNLTAACRACNAAKRDMPLLPFLLRRVDPGAKPAPRPKKVKPPKPPYSFATRAMCVGLSPADMDATFVFPGRHDKPAQVSFPVARADSEPPSRGDIYVITVTRQEVQEAA